MRACYFPPVRMIRSGLTTLVTPLIFAFTFSFANGAGAEIQRPSELSVNTQIQPLAPASVVHSPFAQSSLVSADPHPSNVWTADRMASAVPVEDVPTQNGGIHPPLNRRFSTTSPPAGTPVGTYTAGIPTVGRLFMLGSSGNAQFCSASVVHSAAKNVIATAAHCKPGKSAIFVPMYKNGSDLAHQPFGAFNLTRWTMDSRYLQKTSQASDFDYAFATVSADARGQVENVVHGGLTVRVSPSATNRILAMGYPNSWIRNGKVQDPQGEPVQCATTTRPLSGHHQMQMVCDNFHDGVSGGPWIANYDSKTQLGDLIGSTGGLGGGGNAADDDWVSYSPLFDQNTVDLYNSAASVALPSVALHAPGKKWSDARLTASGQFASSHSGRDDLLVLWKDGEVDAYPNLGNNTFGSEVRLANSGSAFTRAASITSAGFTSAGSDLVVLNVDGSLILYRSVGPSAKFTQMVQLAPKGSAFRYARSIAAGAFVGNTGVNDLFVQRADGEVLLYVDCGMKLGKERQVATSGSSWKYAKSISAGAFPGTGWGVMTVWVDGQVTIDSKISSGPNMAETTLVPEHDRTWSEYFRTLTVGRYTSSTQADDPLVTWADGEVDLYPSTSTRSLGPEHRLLDGE